MIFNKINEILEQHELWLETKGREGSQLNLEGANLEGVNLRGANLEDANLTLANLEGANLTGTNLDGANLTLRQLVQELESQLPKWISVEEGLPEEKQHILMLDDCGGKYSGRGSVLIATNDSDEPTFGTRKRYTHWMPFPQPVEPLLQQIIEASPATATGYAHGIEGKEV